MTTGDGQTKTNRRERDKFFFSFLNGRQKEVDSIIERFDAGAGWPGHTRNSARLIGSPASIEGQLETYEIVFQRQVTTASRTPNPWAKHPVGPAADKICPPNARGYTNIISIQLANLFSLQLAKLTFRLATL